MLLDLLVAEVGDRGCTVLVADNDCDPDVKHLVRDLNSRTGVHVHYVPVPERGVSQARNALIRAASLHVPEWRWLVQYDDDGLPDHGALTRLVEEAERFDADAAAGRVVLIAPVDSSPFLKPYLPNGQSRASGPVSQLTGGQNIVLSRGLVNRMSDPWFSPLLDSSGGEDYDFFLRARGAGARLVWVNDAVVREEIPAERCSTKAIFRRVLQEGSVQTGIDQRFFGRREAAKVLARHAACSPRNLAAGLIRRDPERLRTWALHMAGLSARILRLGGFRMARDVAERPQDTHLVS